jgi:transcriptional regulatory protein LEU3
MGRQRYFENYHPVLPLLDSSRSPEDYYSLSHALFWSIIAVGSRQYRGDYDLLNRISPVLSDLIWTVVASNPLSLPNVQALILMSCWPLPNLHLWTDKSLILNSIALVSSMHIGLHRPGREAEYSKMRMEITGIVKLERTRTWAACVAESERYKQSIGFIMHN